MAPYVGHRGSTEERLRRSTLKGQGCWEWIGAIDGTGYGRLYANGRMRQAHRIAWQVHHRLPVPLGLHVCHHCDNRKCVRPDHLFIGTRSDNMRDCVAKRRHAWAIYPGLTRGERNPYAKLTIDRVRHIRDRLSLGHKQKDIAWAVGVNRTCITKIALRESWKGLS